MTPGGIFDAYDAEVTVWGRKDLKDVEDSNLGLKGSPTKVKATFTPKRTANCVNIEGVSPVEIADNLIGKLVEAKVL